MVVTVRGVIIAPIEMLSNLNRFWMMLLSSRSNTPSFAPMFTMADTSSRLTESGCFFEAIHLVIHSDNQTKGYMMKIMIRRIGTMLMANCLQ